MCQVQCGWGMSSSRAHAPRRAQLTLTQFSMQSLCQGDRSSSACLIRPCSLSGVAYKSNGVVNHRMSNIENCGKSQV